eukprot:Lithocolla_globosa_v1_NODE_1025_length_2941_cov_22.255371.p2 type:complete len:173 gc:universal NODE_1025_length_2941_cov_22.255371:1602-1084(-)
MMYFNKSVPSITRRLLSESLLTGTVLAKQTAALILIFAGESFLFNLINKKWRDFAMIALRVSLSLTPCARTSIRATNTSSSSKSVMAIQSSNKPSDSTMELPNPTSAWNNMARIIRAPAFSLPLLESSLGKRKLFNTFSTLGLSPIRSSKRDKATGTKALTLRCSFVAASNK